MDQYSVDPKNVFAIVKSIEEISDEDPIQPTKVVFSVLRIYKEEEVTELDDEYDKDKKREGCNH